MIIFFWVEINFWRDRNLLRQVATAKKIMNNKYEQTDILNMLKVQPKKNPKKTSTFRKNNN